MSQLFTKFAPIAILCVLIAAPFVSGQSEPEVVDQQTISQGDFFGFWVESPDGEISHLTILRHGEEVQSLEGIGWIGTKMSLQPGTYKVVLQMGSRGTGQVVEYSHSLVVLPSEEGELLNEEVSEDDLEVPEEELPEMSEETQEVEETDAESDRYPFSRFHADMARFLELSRQLLDETLQQQDETEIPIVDESDMDTQRQRLRAEANVDPAVLDFSSPHYSVGRRGQERHRNR